MQTFEPEHKYAKAFGTNMKISSKNAQAVCRAIRNKPLTRVRRLLEDMDIQKRSLEGKYYSNAVHEMLALLNSCQKNAEFKGLNIDKLFVHASASRGTHIHRRRRKGGFGSGMKTTNMEILLVERGKELKARVSKKKIKEQLEGKKPIEEHKESMHKLKEEHKALKEHVHKEHEHKKEE